MGCVLRLSVLNKETTYLLQLQNSQSVNKQVNKFNHSSTSSSSEATIPCHKLQVLTLRNRVYILLQNYFNNIPIWLFQRTVFISISFLALHRIDTECKPPSSHSKTVCILLLGEIPLLPCRRPDVKSIFFPCSSFVLQS